MNYSEFQTLDSNSAFAEFTSVANAKATGLIPNSYHTIFKDKCVCGSDNIISKNLAHLMCCDPHCPVKQGFQLAELFKRFEFPNIGPEKAKHIVFGLHDLFKENSVMEIFKIASENPSAILSITYGNLVIDGISQIKQKEFSFPDLIRMLAIPTLDDTARRITENINNSDELLSQIEKLNGASNFFVAKGIKDKKCAFYLEKHIMDIVFADHYLRRSLRKLGLQKIVIVITGSVTVNGTYVSQDQLVTLFNKASVAKDGTQLFEFVNTKARKSTQYIVASFPSNSASYVEGKRRGVLYTPEQIMEKIRKVVEDYDNATT